MKRASPRKLMTPSIGTSRDLESLRQLHDATYEVLFRYVTFWVGDPKTAGQLTDELFTLLLQEPDIQREDPHFPHRLLLSLAIRAAEAYRQSSAHPAPTAVSEAKLREAMTTLPETQQILLALRYGCRLTTEQVARALGQSTKETRQLQAQAIVALHARMQRP